MKKISIAVATVLLAGVASSWAQTNAFVVDIKGTVTQANGTKVLIKDVTKGVSGLATSTNGVLVAIISQDFNVIEIDEVDPVSGTTVNPIAASARVAILDSGAFNADLESIGDGDNGAVTNFPAGVPNFAGDLMVTGKIGKGTKASTSATVSGVWNDSVNGDGSQPAAIFKGTIKSTGTNAVPTDCCVTF